MTVLQTSFLLVFANTPGISDKDPYKEFIVAALNEVAKEIKNSDAYGELPATSEEANEKKKSSPNNDEDSFSKDNSDDDFDPMNWSP